MGCSGEDSDTSSTEVAETATQPEEEAIGTVEDHSSTGDVSEPPAKVRPETANTLEPTTSTIAREDGCPAPDPQNGAITGVEEWVNARSAPSLEGELLGKIPAGSLVSYYESSLVYDEIAWVQVFDGSRCAWVGATFVKDSMGLRTVAPTTLDTYLFRALRGLEPELQHATEYLVDVDTYEPFDDSVLDRPLADLQDIYRRFPDVAIVPAWPLANDAQGAEDTCVVSHGLYCSYDLVSEAGTIVRVEVAKAGDGVSALSWSEYTHF